MKNRLRILLLTLVMASIKVFGQTSTCETAYEKVDNNPNYEGGMNQLMSYSEKYLTPIISKYHNKNTELTAKLVMTLTINNDGKVVEAVLSKHKLPKECEEEIRKQLLTMTDWNPGLLNGEKVCSKFTWIISCIKWG